VCVLDLIKTGTVPAAKPVKPRIAAVPIPEPRPRTRSCVKGTFSCDWPRLSDGLVTCLRADDGVGRYRAVHEGRSAASAVRRQSAPRHEVMGERTRRARVVQVLDGRD